MPPATFDREYLQRLIAGDPETERHFIGYFNALLRIKLRQKLRSPELIEDVRQETFLRVLQSIRKENGVHSPERLGPFVNSIANNIMLETFRIVAKNQQLPEDLPEQVDGQEDPVTAVVNEERKQIVSEVLSSLPSKDQHLLRQIFFEERDKNLICREMKVSAEYLRVLIHRSKTRFKEALNRKDGKNRD